jgi:tRNA(Ile)-lysidine synthase
MKKIVGVSGGPDSMALLDQLRASHNDLYVVHINYQKRKTALRDEQLVANYCAKYGIDCKILRVNYPGKGNFQDWARKVRYDAFISAAKEQNSTQIYVAHHMDDKIETYLMQKKANRHSDVIGLSPCTTMQNVQILRPLLNQDKKELEKYCQKHGIAYGIDESNLSNDYLRNQIRHEIIDHMSKQEKLALIRQMDQENARWQKQRKEADALKEEVLFHLKDEQAWLILDCYLYAHTQKHFAKDYLDSLLVQLQKNVLIDLQDWWLERAGRRLILEKKEEIPSFTFQNAQELAAFKHAFSRFYYEIQPDGKTIEQFSCHEQDFPVTIRPPKAGDKIEMRFGTKKLSRFFIDRKISRIERMQWMVLANKDDNVIFVPKLGADKTHFDINDKLSMLQYDMSN